LQLDSCFDLAHFSHHKQSGKELASLDLPGAAIGTPMTCSLDGRQDIALTVQRATRDALPERIALGLP
jgi:hypothetical protein